ncbi:MAG: multidrug DMT transporter permease, partial [Bacteroidales bacterium]|nr:multidrug DMT transporter permease [Bacteroidales bacterium]
VIWCLGVSMSILASGKAGFAISYGLGQGATLIAALWGVLIWKEFKGASKSVNNLILFMFLAYLAGLGLLIYAGA